MAKKAPFPLLPGFSQESKKGQASSISHPPFPLPCATEAKIQVGECGQENVSFLLPPSTPSSTQSHEGCHRTEVLPQMQQPGIMGLRLPCISSLIGQRLYKVSGKPRPEITAPPRGLLLKQECHKRSRPLFLTMALVERSYP